MPHASVPLTCCLACLARVILALIRDLGTVTLKGLKPSLPTKLPSWTPVRMVRTGQRDAQAVLTNMAAAMLRSLPPPALSPSLLCDDGSALSLWHARDPHACAGSLLSEASTMSLVPHTPLAWGCIVGVTVLGCLAGCSLQHEPMPLPSVPSAHEEAAPAPVPQAPAPQMHEAAPVGTPATMQIGTASWYGPGFHGRETASGETFNQHALTAAHRTLPLGTEAKVTNLATGQSVQVKINDRGPYVLGRHLDLSRAAATLIGLIQKGVAKVKIEAMLPRQAAQGRAAPWSGMPRTARQRSTVSRPRSVGEMLVRFTIYDPACHAGPPCGAAHAVPSS
jgi:hypothetical protein